ncbi:hypothetical protein BSKO_02467 [Bryopsis sp. KO-2023]|nr:hypothetical protein BSKO_02467 [Bryopsis sp. KO-2023]
MLARTSDCSAIKMLPRIPVNSTELCLAFEVDSVKRLRLNFHVKMGLALLFLLCFAALWAFQRPSTSMESSPRNETRSDTEEYDVPSTNECPPPRFAPVHLPTPDQWTPAICTLPRATISPSGLAASVPDAGPIFDTVHRSPTLPHNVAPALTCLTVAFPSTQGLFDFLDQSAGREWSRFRPYVRHSDPMTKERALARSPYGDLSLTLAIYASKSFHSVHSIFSTSFLGHVFSQYFADGS